MSKEEQIKKITNTGIRLVMRKYPFIISGELIETYEESYTYLNVPEGVKATGVRVILTVDPEIFFSMYSKKTHMLSSILDKKMYWTVRYLSSLYDNTYEDYQELEITDEEILNLFYQTDSVMNPNKKAGYLDFFVRYTFLGAQIEPSWLGFTDYDTAIPYSQYRR
jgi:hypothetical protein